MYGNELTCAEKKLIPLIASSGKIHSLKIKDSRKSMIGIGLLISIIQAH